MWLKSFNPQILIFIAVMLYFAFIGQFLIRQLIWQYKAYMIQKKSKNGLILTQNLHKMVRARIYFSEDYKMVRYINGKLFIKKDVI